VKKVNLLDYIAVIRPTLLFPVWTLLLLGYYRGLLNLPQNYQTDLKLFDFPIILIPQIEIVKMLLLFSMIMSAVYIINQMSDIPTDAVNDKLYLVAQGYVSVKLLIIEIIFLTVGSVILSIYWFGKFGNYFLLIGLSLILGWIYSVPPLRLKGRPILDLLANSVGYGIIAFTIGWISVNVFSRYTLYSSLPYMLCVGATFINTTLPDIEGDRANNDITTGVFLGIRLSSILSVILLIFAILSSIFLKDFIALTATTLSLPFFIYAAIKPKNNIILLTNKIGILILSVIIGIFIPIYFLFLFGTIIAIKLYYHYRFGVKYPF